MYIVNINANFYFVDYLLLYILYNIISLFIFVLQFYCIHNSSNVN
jgi:hypothetical protein